MDHLAFPMGGIGAGMICLDGTGSLSHISVRNSPKMFNQPYIYSAVCIEGEQNKARVLEGPVPRFKIFGLPDTGNGVADSTFGLPRFGSAVFKSQFPFGIVELSDASFELKTEIKGWSPFVPSDADLSSLPVAALEYRFRNDSDRVISAVYSFNTINFMSVGSGDDSVLKSCNGLTLWQPENDNHPHIEGAFNVSILDDLAYVNCAWFRGGWFDSQSFVWTDVERGQYYNKQPVNDGEPSPGGSIYVPFTLQPNESKDINVLLSWYVPKTDLSYGYDESVTPTRYIPAQSRDNLENQQRTYHVPWYAQRFSDIDSVASYWSNNFKLLKKQTELFANTFHDTTLPETVIEAVASNLSILKSPTLLRQADGKLWCWEGCNDNSGNCPGSCTHVWNYAQAIPHLFPDLERSLRETAFNYSQDTSGHQRFRAALPIGQAPHDFLPAADGQLGEIMQVYRDWRISGDTSWLESIWGNVETSLNYCIDTWDPSNSGFLLEPQHNTYDIEFWGANGMCSSIYLGALKAAYLISEHLGEESSRYKILLDRGREYCEQELFNGEYFIQKTQWEGLKAGSPIDFKNNRPAHLSAEGVDLIREEGPKYQYGDGCLSDGVIGAWLAYVCGLGEIIDKDKVKSHLNAVYKYNFKNNLSQHANTQRPTYATGSEGGLILCSWPKGGRPSLPFPYSDEVWTGIEYQVASHMIALGLVEEGIDIVTTCRKRYTHSNRNPFDEYEAGHFYGRALASYSLLQAVTGVRYDAVDQKIYIDPLTQSDFRSFLSTKSGFGVVGIKSGKPFVEVKHGQIAIEAVYFGAPPGI